ncbi:hypothetical protein [Sphingomonas astaxanthinifaciens]|uniref:Uncharacterized protein n=1 Tax=Sphingomonas astaxanthinifaciens DSM 22298 TaxID=1123267 RepID=A0ABQ5Z8W6_9SPHN|nr:hypothetical protein [Sphingomonas astaxanthinifaciens]GLR48435.1 hypothetical protein GCM10007925_21510 [Sphingomonas astaxanthinifaciens DSM 22298]
MNETAATLMSIAMLAAFVLLGFGARLAFRPATRKQGGLMVVAGIVLVANVLVWTV